MFRFTIKKNAPGEARTHDLRVAQKELSYKHDALTDFATGADYEEELKNKYSYTIQK